ncbi:MAG: tcpE [Gammaproteobacteria bacterium]|nr:tcpE [Gammaproteobacteria bacterium]
MLVNIQLRFKQLAFNAAKQQAFLEDIAALVEDGVPLSQAVDIISKMYTGISIDVANSIQQAIAQGKHFAEGMHGWFAPHIIELIRAGEEGGTLAQTLQAAANSLKQTNSITNALVNSLMYPIIVFCMGLAVTVYIKQSVFQSFALIKPVDTWPAEAKNLLALASFVQYWWWMTLIVLAIVGWLVSRFIRDYIGNLRHYFDQFPIISLYRKLVAARLMETLGLLIANGVIFKNALRILQYNANPYLASHLLSMEYRLSGGKENLAEVMDTGLIDKPIIQRLQVVALSRGFEHALVRQGQLSNQQTMQSVMLTGRISGGILLVGAAILAAYIVMSVYAVANSVTAG